MKKIFGIVLGFIFFQVHAQNLFTNPGFESGVVEFSMWTDAAAGYQATWSATTAEKHSGNQSARINVTAVGSNANDYYNSIWRVQVSRAGFAVTEGEKLLISFWAKSDANRKFEFGITKNSPDWRDYYMESVSLSTTWTYYEMVFVAPQTTTTDIRLVLKAGTAVGNVYIDDVSITRQGNDNNWYATAEQRIQTIRKGDLEVVLENNAGQPIANCPVRIELTSHDFKWGTAMSISAAQNATEDWYKSTAASLFHYGVMENDFKWPSMEYSNGNVNYTAVQRYFDWASTVNWDFRAHTLVWSGSQAGGPNGTDYWITPQWLWSVSPDSARKLIRRRIEREMTYYRNVFTEYDVINEPVHETELEDWLGKNIHVQIVQWARAADPTAKLYVNDYANIDGNTSCAFRQYLQGLQDQGAGIDGIGLQGHFGNVVDVRVLKARLDYLATLNKPIKITEFDMNVVAMGLTEQQMATEYAKVMRTAFSHPAVEGFLFWGFWDARHWIPGAGLYRSDRTPKLAADSVHHLLNEKWTTKLNAVTDATGKVTFNGFYGTYNIVTSGCVAGNNTAIAYFNSNDKRDTTTLTGITTGSTNRVPVKTCTVFPNPGTQSYVDIQWESSTGNVYTIQIVDATGRIVQEKNNVQPGTDSAYRLSLPPLTEGSYTIIITGEEGVYQNQWIKM
ncbi:MAG: endo-1,4-beta-xylanase [Cytophagaceae bacterium]|jgi:endo-1,4-beta-xylanase|nr:endo-1,4-beta-xylanase [Cytophagaceae bacterium]